MHKQIILGLGLSVVAGAVLFTVLYKESEELRIDTADSGTPAKQDEIRDGLGRLEDRMEELERRTDLLEARLDGGSPAPPSNKPEKIRDRAPQAKRPRPMSPVPGLPRRRRKILRPPPAGRDLPTQPASFKDLLGRDIGDLEKLAKAGNLPALDAITFLLKAKDPELREDAAQALGDVVKSIRKKGQNVDPALLENLRPLVLDPHHKVREEVAESLAEFPAADSGQILERMLEDKSVDVIRRAIEGLRDLDWRAAQSRIASLAQAEDVSVAYEAARTLRRWGDDPGADSVLHRFASGLSNPDTAIRKRAVELIRRIGGRAAIPLLRRALEDEDPDVKSRAERALANLEKRFAEEDEEGEGK